MKNRPQPVMITFMLLSALRAGKYFEIDPAPAPAAHANTMHFLRS